MMHTPYFVSLCLNAFSLFFTILYILLQILDFPHLYRCVFLSFDLLPCICSQIFPFLLQSETVQLTCGMAAFMVWTVVSQTCLLSSMDTPVTYFPLTVFLFSCILLDITSRAFRGNYLRDTHRLIICDGLSVISVLPKTCLKQS